MQIKVKLDEYGILPTKAYEWDAGFDIYSPEEFELGYGETKIIKTGVHMEIPKGFVGFIKSKSGLNTKCDIISEGVVDAGYTGEICVKLYREFVTNNTGKTFATFKKGEKLTQIVILPIPDVELTLVDEIKETDRGANGFGSTGR